MPPSQTVGGVGKGMQLTKEGTLHKIPIDHLMIMTNKINSCE